MQFIFDHLIAVLIAAVVIMIVASNQILSMESSVEDTSFYAAKNNSLNFAKIIQEDLNLTLHRYDTGRAPFSWPIPVDADGRTTLFTFYRDSLVTGPIDTVRLETRYRLQFEDSLSTDDGKIPLFRIDREECVTTTSGVCSPWVNTGSSAGLVTDFKITPLRTNKSPAANVAESHYLDVRFTMSPPYRTNSQTVNVLHWNSLLQVQPF